MELYEAIRKRRSVRSYRSDKVPKDALLRVLEAARLAPSWCNFQCWRYIVVDDPAIIEKMSSRAAAFGAPMFVVLCADPEQSGKKDNKDYYLVDAAISMEHIILAATAEGLGTCWLGGMLDEKNVKAVLGIPDNLRVVAMTPLGYASIGAGGILANNVVKSFTGPIRKPISEIVFKNKYGDPIK